MADTSGALRVGTRGSMLARTQAGLVCDLLRQQGLECTEVIVSTAGDSDQHTPLAATGGTGLFVRELYLALHEGRVDIAVHSYKDLPLAEEPGLVIAAVPARAEVRDVVITRTRGGIGSVPPGGNVGTSSPRRSSQLSAVRPDIHFEPIRGNVDTRLRKVQSGDYDGVVLAAAGLDRLGIDYAAIEALDVLVCTPAAAQGALAVQVRSANVALKERVAAIADSNAEAAVAAERAFESAAGGGCTSPTGAYARVEADDIHLVGFGLLHGAHIVRGAISGPMGDAPLLGADLARRLGLAGVTDTMRA